MKNLKGISFVGVDVNTDIESIALSTFHSDIACEWSVLYSDSKSVGNYIRYPSYDFCLKFLDQGWRSNFLQYSLHLCGSVIDRYLKEEKDVLDLCKKAYRIQLNLNINSYPDHDKLANDLLLMMSKHGHKLILQQNKTKEKFMKTFLNKTQTKIGLLHDGSGGFGRVISQIDPPDNFHLTGYAGGIKPENVAEIVGLIEKNNPDNLPYYIDMESGVRDNNIFSLEKCRQVITNLT